MIGGVGKKRSLISCVLSQEIGPFLNQILNHQTFLNIEENRTKAAFLENYGNS